jgi:hypothetical protein
VCGSKFNFSNIENFILKSNIVHDLKYDYSKAVYTKGHEKICIICPEHGEFWQEANNHLCGSKCPVCNGKIKLTTSEFISNAIKIHGDKYDYSKVKYINSHTKVCIICHEKTINGIEHGEFWQTPLNHTSGYGCKICGLKYNLSETKLFNLLKNEFSCDIISRQYSPDWLNNQSLDIFLPEYNIAIEYQGEQHFKPVSIFGGEIGFNKTLERDKRKYNLCKKNELLLFYFAYENKYLKIDYNNYLDKVYLQEDHLVNKIKELIKIKKMKEKIKLLIQCSDIHIKANKGHERHREVLSKFIDDCKEHVSKYDQEECRILLLGDIIDQKLQVSNDLYDIVNWFIRELSSICPVLIICGNHDLNTQNFSKKGFLDSLISVMMLPNVKYIDMELSYKSGIFVDNNLAFCLYSIFDDYKRPDIELHKIEYNSNNELKYIGLFHGPIISSRTDIGYTISEGMDIERFVGCDITLCGDIHKRSILPYDGGVAIYPSSLIQVNFGENVSSHGYMTINADTLEYEEHDIESDYGFYKFRINSIEDLENGTEEFINF